MIEFYYWFSHLWSKNCCECVFLKKSIFYLFCYFRIRSTALWHQRKMGTRGPDLQRDPLQEHHNPVERHDDPHHPQDRGSGHLQVRFRIQPQRHRGHRVSLVRVVVRLASDLHRNWLWTTSRDRKWKTLLTSQVWENVSNERIKWDHWRLG